MKKAMIIGAGASGRGHVGQLAFASGYDLVFVDRDRALVDALRHAGRYRVRLVGAPTRDVDITGFRILHMDEREAVFREFLATPLLFTSVCPNNLKDVAAFLRPMVAEWLRQNGSDTKNILCCENMNNGSTVLRTYLLEGFPADLRPALEQRFGFVDTMISRVVARPRDPLSLLGEAYSEWTADCHAFRGTDRPAIETLEWVEHQDRYLQRKLYIHNTGHATLGYLGFIAGYTYVHEAAQDARIMDVCKRAIAESGWAIEKEHGFTADEILRYRNALTDKCVCAELPDELLRVVREPLRKLGPDERFFGPLQLMLRHGRDPEYLLYGLCAALLAEIPGDDQSQTIRTLLRERGVGAVLAELKVVVPERVTARIATLLPVVTEQFVRRP